MTTFKLTRAKFLWLGILLGLAFVAYEYLTETPSEAFDDFIEGRKRYCAQYRPGPNSTDCDILKTGPVDPLSTPEGRFAHSIKLPDPLSPDSGYRWWMTQDDYFDHLCKTEAGVFIYERVKGVRGILMMRPRAFDHNSENHLYAPEAPFLHAPDEVPLAPWKFVASNRYVYLEASKKLPISLGEERRLHASILEYQEPNSSKAKFYRYFGYDNENISSLRIAPIPSIESRYGYTWRGILRPHDRELGIGGGELIVVEIPTKRVVAFMRGYAKFTHVEGMGQSGFQWDVRCPKPQKEAFAQDRDFLMKVLSPIGFSAE